jgi:hypothetical protein
MIALDHLAPGAPSRKTRFSFHISLQKFIKHSGRFSLLGFAKSLGMHNLGSHLARTIYAKFGLKSSTMLSTAKRWNLWFSSW